MDSSHSWPDQLARYFETRREKIHRVVSRIISNPDDALDIMLEAFHKAAANWHSLSGDLEPWLVTIARNLAFTFLRDNRRRQTFELPPDVSVDSFEGGVLDRLLAARVVRQLDESELEIVPLMDGRVDEGAKSLGISVPAFKSRKHRARKRVRALAAA